MTEGTKSSGTGVRPINHLQRLAEVKTEREAAFQKVIENDDACLIEYDHGINGLHLCIIYA